LKSQFEPIPPLLMPTMEVTLLKFRSDHWHQKSRVPGLSYGIVCENLCLAVLVQYRHVTNRHLDGQTHSKNQHLFISKWVWTPDRRLKSNEITSLMYATWKISNV